jgi:lipid A ethanolaminephosphotransferase
MPLLRARFRPMMRLESVLLMVIAWMIATMNGPWWTAVGEGREWRQPADWLFILASFVALVALHFVLLAPWFNRWTIRPLLSVVVIVSAAAAHFMRNYAVMLDPTMIQNALNTDAREARELLSWSLAGSVLLWSAPPVAFIWWVRIERHRWLGATLVRMGWMTGCLLIALLAALPVNRDLTSTLRNHRELRYLITPGNLIYGLAARSASGARDVSTRRAPVGTDARLMRVSLTNTRPRVFVLVVGETARAANFSLLGYTRTTTPELAMLDVTSFRDVRSCGTSTEVSVPCMFSPYGRVDYDERRIRHSEGLLNVLARAGYAVKWIDNQSGCKGVCQGAGIEYRRIDPKSKSDLCTGDECLDGILVRELESELQAVGRDTVIVLHMMGNHGPAYFRRYPAEFRRFMPDCATAELRKCMRAEVVNAYDNAILYTDHVLASLIRALKRRADSIDGALLYLSDHGESLGEAGLYLHGLPYSIAPDTQKRVPMIAWLSPQFAASGAVDRACLQRRASEPLSHDNLFHSVLGVLDVQTSAYLPGRDIFESCRGEGAAKLALDGVPAGRRGG